MRLTVDDLAAALWPILVRRYAAPGSAKTLDKDRVTLRRFLVQFRSTLAADIGPKDLPAFRDGLLLVGSLCRRAINARVQVIRRITAATGRLTCSSLGDLLELFGPRAVERGER